VGPGLRGPSAWSAAPRRAKPDAGPMVGRARLDAAPRQVTGQRYATVFHRVKPSPHHPVQATCAGRAKPVDDVLPRSTPPG
jgi:hypothetical protein